jgi:hypothetical protein
MGTRLSTAALILRIVTPTQPLAHQMGFDSLPTHGTSPDRPPTLHIRTSVGKEVREGDYTSEWPNTAGPRLTSQPDILRFPLR